MKFFKLKHKKSGLFYCPVRQISVNGLYVKSNLSKVGKIYHKSPLNQIKSFLDHTDLEESKVKYFRPVFIPKLKKFLAEDFEIVYLN